MQRNRARSRWHRHNAQGLAIEGWSIIVVGRDFPILHATQP